MLQLMVDTSTWLDLAKRRDGQKTIWAIHDLVSRGDVRLLVPEVVIDEFERNRPRIESSMTDSVAERFRLIRRDISDYGGSTDYAEALGFLSGLAHEVPLIGAMTTRNFDDVLNMLKGAESMRPSTEQMASVVDRGLGKLAPFHRAKNSVADAVIIEIYGAVVEVGEPGCKYAFVTSNSDDFSNPVGDKRVNHPDLDKFFEGDSKYGLGVDGLTAILRHEFAEDYDELLEESDFQEDPRRLDEILQAEREFFDRVWYHRSLQHQYKLEDSDEPDAVDELLRIAGPGRRRIEAAYLEPGQLGPYSDFDLGMLNGKLSALRWVLGSEWDFLDT